MLVLWFWSDDWRAWLGFTTMTDLFEDCFWFLRLDSLRIWLFIIQLLCTIRLSLPASLVNSPIKLYFLHSFYLFWLYVSLLLRKKECKLESLVLTICSFWRFNCSFELVGCRGTRAGSGMLAWVLSILILSWSRSFIFCYFLTYKGVSDPRETSVGQFWCKFYFSFIQASLS